MVDFDWEEMTGKGRTTLAIGGILLALGGLALAIGLIWLLWWAVSTIGTHFGLPFVVIVAIFVVLLLKGH